MADTDTNESQPSDADVQRVMQHVEALGEHFEMVHIFCSRHSPTDKPPTMAVNRGSGNWFARYGQIKEWVLYEDERIKLCARPRDAN